MQELTNSVERLLADACGTKRVREIESGVPIKPLWGVLETSGFLDALLPERNDGAGLSLREALPIFLLCGRYAVPVPIAQTMLARALLASGGQTPPRGPITLATSQLIDGSLRCSRAPYGAVAEWVLTEIDGTLELLKVSDASIESTGVHGSFEADIEWPGISPNGTSPRTPAPLRAIGACLYAAQLAGAMSWILDTTLRYANQRVQFGRPIGKFQIIQQHLSVIAEQTLSAQMAAQIGCRSETHLPDAALAAVAKARASEAATTVAALAHAVHGAIGFTAEYDLHLYTRRLHEWRLAYGSETYWHAKIGSDLVAANESALDFVRTRLYPTA